MQNNRPLTFGSIISLKIHRCPNLYLFSQGFFDSHVFLFDFSNEGENLHKMPDFFSTTFKILPFTTQSHYKFQGKIKETLIDSYDEFQIKCM